MSSGSPCSSGTVCDDHDYIIITSYHHVKTQAYVQSTSLLISVQGKESPTIATTYILIFYKRIHANEPTNYTQTSDEACMHNNQSVIGVGQLACLRGHCC